jgi:hypothetical protein
MLKECLDIKLSEKRLGGIRNRFHVTEIKETSHISTSALIYLAATDLH